MSKDLEILQENDVISVFKHDEGRFVSGDTIKAQQLLTEYENYIKGQAKNADNSEMCIHGIECEVLRQNGEHQGWRKGKIKFVVQFEPDVVESNKSSNGLDDIRQQIDK